MKLAPPVSSHPFMLVRGLRNPKVTTYHRRVDQAIDRIARDLKGFTATFRSLGADDALEAIRHLSNSARGLTRLGGVVEGVVDPYRNIKYRAELVRRKDMS